MKKNYKFNIGKNGIEIGKGTLWLTAFLVISLVLLLVTYEQISKM